MYVRVVRFTGVDGERMQSVLSRIEASGGPPSGVPVKGVKFLHDADAGTAVVLQYYASAEDMQAGARFFGERDAASSPGNRESVDMCELKLELEGP